MTVKLDCSGCEGHAEVKTIRVPAMTDTGGRCSFHTGYGLIVYN